MPFWRLAHLALAFALELVLFFSAGYYGYIQGKSTLGRWMLAIACFAVVVTLWGIFAAPKSAYRLPFHTRLLFELTLFSVGAWLLYKTDHATLAYAFTAAFLLSETLAYVYPAE